jgi:hypothetical protein
MGIIVRLFALSIGYVLACTAAATVFTLGTLSAADDTLVSQIPSVALWWLICIEAAIMAALAMLPALLIIALAEGFAWRSVILYGVLGGVLALALGYGIDFAGYLGGPDTLVAHEREVLAAAGIAGGLTYWAVAGRNAGAWSAG